MNTLLSSLTNVQVYVFKNTLNEDVGMTMTKERNKTVKNNYVYTNQYKSPYISN